MSSYRRRPRKLPELLVVLWVAFRPTPRNLQEAYQSRTAHHVPFILLHRRKSFGLDLYLTIPSFARFYHVVR